MTTQAYRYLFGPVPSRRLGLSLGVDLVPSKTCSLDCVYCESGTTTHLTVKRREWVPTEAVKEEISRYLLEHDAPDAVTFSGAGEPTLHTGIGDVARHIKKEAPGTRVVLLTNGTLFHMEDVRRDVLPVDLVVASYDAFDSDLFKVINRPHSSLNPQVMAEGLLTFREMYGGEFWLEFFVVPGVNDQEKELANIARVAKELRPHRIQVNTLDRPGAEAWVKPADAEILKRVAGTLEAGEVISSYDDSRKRLMVSDDVEAAILGMIGRRPATLADFVSSLGVNVDVLEEVLDQLLKKGCIVEECQGRGRFYKLSNGPKD